MPMSGLNHSCDRPENFVATYRRPPHTTRRTATTVLAGNHGWLDSDDTLTLRTYESTTESSASTSASTVSPTSQPVLRDVNTESTVPARRGTITSTASAKGGRGKAKAKTPSTPRQVDMGVSIIPICAPGTGTPTPSPEPPSPPPHPHLRRPPQSSASTSSAVSSLITTSAGSRPDFDAGAQRATVGGTAAAATVGKRSRGPSHSQRPSMPISPPVTSPNTSTSELPFTIGYDTHTTVPPPTAKRAREGREPQRRKRRKTETRGDVPPVVEGGHVGEAVRRQAPARRKGWKGWVMVSDTEGSDQERADTPPIVILEKKTRSGRDFDQDILPRVNRRGRSTVSIGTESVTTSAAPLSFATTA